MQTKLTVLIGMVLVAWAGMPHAGAASHTENAKTSWAGLVLVRPAPISDAPGTGSPPLPAGQDGDGYADTDETVDLPVVVSNKSGMALTNVAVRLWSDDLKVDCISNPVAVIGSMAVGATVTTSPFRFRVSPNADRGGAVPAAVCASGVCSNGAGRCTTASNCVRGINDAYAARFIATVTATQIPAEGEADVFDVELDLNSATAVKATSVFNEGFEAGLGGMTLLSMDDNMASTTLSSGKHCQYTNPDFPNATTYQIRDDCYLGFTGGQTVANDWHLHDPAQPDAGRAALGSNSLHYGIHQSTELIGPYDTYGLAQMDAIRTKNALTLAARICRDDPAAGKRACNVDGDCAVVGGGPCVAAQPELSFQHQISLIDDRYLRDENHTIDRAIVSVLTATAPTWRKIYPYENVYDRMGGGTYYSYCYFDPQDDGNDEDSFFQPGDPNRLYGPSSTCAPEFAFSYLGDTGQAFASGNMGRASDGPGTQGSLGIGTWVTSRFDLSAFRGRSIRVRWLITSTADHDSHDYEQVYRLNSDPLPVRSYDDGWYLDDVRVTQTVSASTPTVSLDAADRSSLAACANTCTSMSAAIEVSPSPSPAPGATVTLSAGASAPDQCPGGQLSYEYWVDANANGILGDPQDYAFAGPSFSPSSEHAPLDPVSYGVRVRCSSRPSCVDDAVAPALSVECPPPSTYSPEAWTSSLHWGEFQINYFVPEVNDVGATADVVYGTLSTLRSTGAFGGETCLLNDEEDLEYFADLTHAVLGDGIYFLVRGSEPRCNETPSYSTFHPKENPTNPGKRDLEITACPAP